MSRSALARQVEQIISEHGPGRAAFHFRICKQSVQSRRCCPINSPRCLDGATALLRRVLRANSYLPDRTQSCPDSCLSRHKAHGRLDEDRTSTRGVLMLEGLSYAETAEILEISEGSEPAVLFSTLVVMAKHRTRRLLWVIFPCGSGRADHGRPGFKASSGKRLVIILLFVLLVPPQCTLPAPFGTRQLQTLHHDL